ncbi:hypothetical protein ABPG75_013625 [Micractinium tetrahymenae]
MHAEEAATPPSDKPTQRRARVRATAAAQEAAAIDGTPMAVQSPAIDAPTAAAANAADEVAAAAAAAAGEQEQAPAATPTPPRKKSARPPAKSPSQLVLGDQSALELKAQRIAELLGRLYPEPPIPLDHATTFQLLCAVLLSAQTTDKKVNECTPALFQLAPDAHAMASADLPDIAACIRTLGLAPTKARNLKAMSQILVEQHGGQVPASMEALEALPGVGHKTASVVMCQAFGQDAFPVDTHIHRLAQRWGLTDGKSVEQTEADLKLLFPQHLWKDLHLQIIYLGREHCPAKSHDPLLCPVCSWAAVPPYNKAGVSPQKAGGPKNGKPCPCTATAVETAFEKELRRRGMGSGSFSDEEAAARAAAPRSPFHEQQAGGRQQQRAGPRPPPSFRDGDDGEVPPQLAKSRALNSEGLEGFLPRAWELLKLGGSFFLAFSPFILAVSLTFGAIYFVFGDAFVHGGSPAAGPPPYYDPDLLLAEPTADPMVPLDLR